jgi:hypothetical protein
MHDDGSAQPVQLIHNMHDAITAAVHCMQPSKVSALHVHMQQPAAVSRSASTAVLVHMRLKSFEHARPHVQKTETDSSKTVQCGALEVTCKMPKTLAMLTLQFAQRIQQSTQPIGSYNRTINMHPWLSMKPWDRIELHTHTSLRLYDASSMQCQAA